MALTKSFNSDVQERAKSDPTFRRTLLRQSIDAILNSEMEVGYRLIRDYAGSVTYLDQIATELGLADDGVAWLFDAEVNVGGAQLIAVINAMLKREGMSLVTRRDIGPARGMLS